MPDSSPTASARTPASKSAEELGQKLLRLLENWRVLSLSLHNSQSELLWLNQGVFGADQQLKVQDALDLFALERERNLIESRVEDGRRSLFLVARNAAGERCGLAYALLTARASHNRDAPFIWTPSMHAVMQRFSALLQAQPGTLAGGQPRRRDAPPVSLRARRYSRLRSGGATQRYELTRPCTSADEDMRAVARLTEYLAQHRERYEGQPVSFAVPIAAASVSEPHFIASAEVSLQVADIDASQIGFCIPAELWNAQREEAERFAAECGRIGCFLVLDDFTLSEAGIALLRAPALRCLKLQSQLTGDAMHDKYAQAMLAAIIQASRVLGLYCVAKNAGPAALTKWLARAGIEFVDSLDPAAETQSLQQVS
jgi:hypothetical protein